MEKIIFIKYGELSTKKGNIKYFINKLYHNVLKKLKDDDVIITKNSARMYIELTRDNENIVIDKLQNIFGIHEIVISYKIETDIDSIKEKSLLLLKQVQFDTFKIQTKRADKNYPYLSMEISALIGGHILDSMDNVRVDVHNPCVTLNIEIRKDWAYLYTSEIKGLGGYPVGIQGKGLLMMSGGIDSPVAGFLSIKRGIDIECLYFESPPHTSLEARNKVVDLTKKLDKYGNDIKLHVVPFTKIQEAIYKNIDPNYMITIMRRMMYRIAEAYANKIHAPVLINGESIGQVASQTLTSMRVINSVTNLPIIRPVSCLDKLEIIEIAKKIGTYNISILPFEDCCTVFLPDHPIINPSLGKCVDLEKRIDYSKMVEECIEDIELIDIGNLEYNRFNELL